MQRLKNGDRAQVVIRFSCFRRLSGAVASLLLSALGSTSVLAISSTDRWEVVVPKVPQNEEMQAAGINTRTIPVGPTGIEAIITEENPACFTVKYVFKNSPAYGKVKVGDLICGANGKKITTPHTFRSTQGQGKGNEGPLTEMAPLIEESQGGDGKLDLMVHPGGDTKVTQKVSIQIKPVGRFSATYPYNCPRSDKMVTELCEVVERDMKEVGGRTHVINHMRLALMASGEKKYESLIREHARGSADHKVDLMGAGFPSWNMGYEGVFLGEYYLKTKDKTVLSRIEQINIYYRDAIDHSCGGYSHRPRPVLITTVAAGGPPGYGSMGFPGALAMLAMSLYKAGGVPYDEFTYERIHQAYLRSTSEEGTGGGYGFTGAECIQIDVKNPNQGLSGRGVGYRCMTGMKDITEYKIAGVGLWCNSSPTNRLKSGKEPATGWMWDDTSWLEKERDRNIVEQWGANRRMVIRCPVIPEPAKPYNTSRGNGQGACGMEALSHTIGNKGSKSWEYLAKHAANCSAFAPGSWFQGHCSGGMHQLWQALGAARADKENFRAFMDYNKYWFIMMQRFDGSYASCPNRDKQDQDAGYGQYTMPTANAAVILALPRKQLQITGGDSPAVSAPAKASRKTALPWEKAAPVVKTVRPARTLGAENIERLDNALLRTLASLSAIDQLKPVPIKLSMSQARVWLKAAHEDGKLTLQVIEGDQSGDFAWANFTAADRVTLAQLIAHLKPESGDAQAMAGVYAEHNGYAEAADQYYEKAGERSRQKLESLFE